MILTISSWIEVGFNHVVFIIRKDIEKEFKDVIGDRIASVCSAHDVTVDYVFQVRSSSSEAPTASAASTALRKLLRTRRTGANFFKSRRVSPSSKCKQ